MLIFNYITSMSDTGAGDTVSILYDDEGVPVVRSDSPEPLLAEYPGVPVSPNRIFLTRQSLHDVERGRDGMLLPAIF